MHPTIPPPLPRTLESAPPSPLRRRLLVAGALSSVAWGAGCANSVTARNIGAAIAMVSGERKDGFDPKYALSLPYASIAVGFGDGPRALMVLGRYDGDALHWISADRAALVTRKGRVVRTAGLAGDNLAETIFSRPDWLGTPLSDLPAGARTQRRIDLMPQRRMGLPIDAEIVTEGFEAIRTIGADADITVVRVRERCECRTLAWNFENLYWMHPATGAVVRSRQHISPGMPTVGIEVVKPAA